VAVTSEKDTDAAIPVARILRRQSFIRSLAEGVPGDVLKHPRVIAAYIGTAAVLR
jgi:hypothetical protein